MRTTQKKTHVEYQTRQINTFGYFGVLCQRDLIANSDEQQSNEELGPWCWPSSYARIFPCTTPGSCPTAHQGHEHIVFVAEADIVHDHAHVIHHRIHSSELAKENHDVCVDYSPSCAWFCEESNHTYFLISCCSFSATTDRSIPRNSILDSRASNP